MPIDDIIADAAQWLIDKLQDIAAREVTFTRGSRTTSTIVGTPTKVEYKVMDDEGFMTLVTMFDWRFETADLVLGGEAFTPREGDVISETLNGQAIEYAVMPIMGKPASEWEDTAGLMTIVHSKRKK